jgi:hypothetical protein
MNRFRIAFAAAPPALGLLLGLLLALSKPAAAIPMDTVLLQGLDKITARVSTIKVPVGGTVTFGALQIKARACDKHPPEETPEAAAFLEVTEVKPDEKPVPIFSGWMFASSPALSALEHPVYDLIVLDCLNSDSATPLDTGEDNPAAPNAPAAGTAKPAAKPAGQSSPAPSTSKPSSESGGSSQ